MKQSHVWDVNESHCFRLLMMMVVIVVVVPLLMMIIVFECLSNLATMFVIKISQMPNKHRGKVDDGIFYAQIACAIWNGFSLAIENEQWIRETAIFWCVHILGDWRIRVWWWFVQYVCAGCYFNAYANINEKGIEASARVRHEIWEII